MGRGLQAGAVNLELEGRAAIVCGASSGMGLAIAEALAEEGAHVVMFARRSGLTKDAVRIRALPVQGDLRRPEDLERLVETAVGAFGRVDVLVNNGGGPPGGPARGIADDDVQDGVRLLLSPAVRLTALCLPYLERSGRGRIVNIASYSVRQPIDGLAVSNIVRPGVVAWARALAAEVGSRGITVNTIAPGRIDTPRLADRRRSRIAEIPVRRFGRPRDVADLVCFLASARASYVTGTVIPVDGGLTRSSL